MDKADEQKAINKLDKALAPTPGPWYYVSGAVWTTPYGPDDLGDCIAQRASNSRIFPTQRDANMRLCAAAPKLLATLEKARVKLLQHLTPGPNGHYRRATLSDTDWYLKFEEEI